MQLGHFKLSGYGLLSTQGVQNPSQKYSGVSQSGATAFCRRGPVWRSYAARPLGARDYLIKVDVAWATARSPAGYPTWLGAGHGRAFFSGFPETTAPELISSSILGSRSDKPDQFDHTTADFQNTLQTLRLTWFGGVSATSGVACFTSTFLRSTC